MVGCSLTHRGEELLGQRGGLEAYIAERKTMGIPLLYPWANRLSSRRFTVAGREVDIDPERTPLRLDGGGLPMHGLLSAAPGWRVEHQDEATLEAVFDFAAHPDAHGGVPVRSHAAHRRHARRQRRCASRPRSRLRRPACRSRSGSIRTSRCPASRAPTGRSRSRSPSSSSSTTRCSRPGTRTAVDIPAGPLGDRTFDDAYLAPSGAVRARRRRPPDRARVRSRLPVRAGVRAAR